MILLIFQSKYLQSFIYIFEKKLNYEYYINVNFICLMEGIIGFIILLIFDLFYVFIFEKQIKFIFKINMIEEHTIPLFIILPIYTFSISIYNISRL